MPITCQGAGGPLADGAADVVISCLASRTGSKKDSFAIDYQATLNCLEAARTAGARHFVLLSAFCVKSARVAGWKVPSTPSDGSLPGPSEGSDRAYAPRSAA